MSYGPSRLPVHKCTDRCRCPEHGEVMIYWPYGDLHACQYPDCEYAEGVSVDDLHWPLEII